MDKKEFVKKLLDGVLLCDNHPYAMYFHYHDNDYYDLNGLLPSNGYDANFRLASVTKQFIASGIVYLTKDKKLSFETTVSEIYPNLPSYFNNIKIINLLNHTSGIYDYEEFLENEYSVDNQVHDKDVFDFLQKTSNTYFEVGTQYRYSNTAYILLGLIIERLSGMSIDDYLGIKIFKRGGLVDTRCKKLHNTINNRAYGHQLVDGKLVESDQYWCSATIGDGGIYSNIMDMKKWVHNMNVYYEELKDSMCKPNILPNGENTHYGFGLRILDFDGYTLVTHSGDTIGTNTITMFSHELDFELVFLTNLGPTNIDLIIDNLYKMYQNKEVEIDTSSKIMCVSE